MLKTAALCVTCAAFTVSFAVSCAPRSTRAGASAEKKETITAPPPKQEVNLAYSPGTKNFAPGDIAVEEEKWYADSMRRAEFEQVDIEDTLVRRAAEAVRPVAGGKATVYLQRGFLEDAITEMVSIKPFGQDGSERRLFKVTDSTHRRLEFTLTHTIKRADGRRMTALDFVELWSRRLKDRPALGLALFRHVQGAEGYVSGKEPLVGGFNAADEQTIRIRLAKPDPLAFQRLRSPALIGGLFMLGPYYPAAAGSAEGAVKLLPNANSLSSDAAYLSECTVRLGDDPDAIASFKQGKYAAMALYSAADLETARTELEGKASLVRLPSDRYFLASKSANDQLRKFISGAVSGLDMLKNVVKAEGEEIFCVTAHDAITETRAPRIRPPELPKPIKLIYRNDDPISTLIAEKLRADFSNAGLVTDAIGGNAETYERILVSGRYDCAVGWAPEAVLENLTEQLHLASMWFDDETDPRARLTNYREIPLFSVNNYMLLREDIRFYGNRISGIWSQGSNGK
jgi:hypothetical protein